MPQHPQQQGEPLAASALSASSSPDAVAWAQKAAKEIVNIIAWGPSDVVKPKYVKDITLAITRAVAEEQETCARIADVMGEKHGSPASTPYAEGTWDQSACIAGKIRARGQTPTGTGTSPRTPGVGADGPDASSPSPS